jgi:hypothetical protein
MDIKTWLLIHVVYIPLEHMQCRLAFVFCQTKVMIAFSCRGSKNRRMTDENGIEQKDAPLFLHEEV